MEELVRALILETSVGNESSEIRVEGSPQPDGFDVEVSELDMSALYAFPDKGRDILRSIVKSVYVS